MKIQTLIALALAACLTTSYGRIGETEAEITKRYETIVNLGVHGMGGQEVLIYRVSGMDVGVVFVDGKSAAEFYSKIDKTEISKEEINVILKAN
jgi:hypothetical protein